MGIPALSAIAFLKNSILANGFSIYFDKRILRKNSRFGGWGVVGQFCDNHRIAGSQSNLPGFEILGNDWENGHLLDAPIALDFEVDLATTIFADA